MKIGRNEPCPCGSGQKYKKCCLKKEAEMRDAPLISPEVFQRVKDKYKLHGPGSESEESDTGTKPDEES